MDIVEEMAGVISIDQVVTDRPSRALRAWCKGRGVSLKVVSADLVNDRRPSRRSLKLGRPVHEAKLSALLDSRCVSALM
ncbi:MAG: hypothetical protein AB7F76_07870 [Parvibaculaceae bacterium]